MKLIISVCLALLLTNSSVVADSISIGDFHAGREVQIDHDLLSIGLPYLIARFVNSSGDCRAYLPTSAPKKTIHNLYGNDGSPRIREARLFCEEKGADRYLLGRSQQKANPGEKGEIVTTTFYIGTKASNKTEAFTTSFANTLSVLNLVSHVAEKICPLPKEAATPNIPPPSLPSFSRALRLSRSGDLKRADKVVKKLCSSCPEFADAYYLSGLIALKAKKPYSALKSFSKARELDPHFSLPAYEEGKIWLSLQRPTLAEKAFVQAGLIQPSLFEARLQLGILNARHGDFKEAAISLKEALRQRPDDVTARYWMAYCLAEGGKKERALSVLEQLVIDNPNHCSAHFLLGKLYFQKIDFRRAEVELRMAARLCPDDYKTHRLLGEALSRQGKHAEAARELRKAIKLQNRR